MLLTYQYKLDPTPEQAATMETWGELLRRHWNYALGQRLDWLHRTRSQVDRCSLVLEPIGEILEKVDYYLQASQLKQTKELFPDYRDIYADCQQQNLMRLDKAWKRWLTPDKKGKRGGRPRFKKRGDISSFTFPRVNCSKAGATLTGNILKLSKIGEIRFILHRPIPDGFVLKQATIVRRADGWYVSFSLEDNTVPNPLPVDEIKSAVGIDVGLEKFLTTSDGQAIEVPQYYRKSIAKLAHQQRKLSRKQKGYNCRQGEGRPYNNTDNLCCQRINSKRSALPLDKTSGSKNYQKQAAKVARIHLHISRQRKEFHYQVAHWLLSMYDLVAFENLNIKGLTRTHLAKSILDCAWGSFLSVLQAVAAKRGKQAVGDDPKRTSIECSGCGKRVEKELSVRVHECPHCKLVLDRDWNAAINILNRVIRAVGLPLSGCGGLGDTQLKKQQVSFVNLRSPHYTACS